MENKKEVKITERNAGIKNIILIIILAITIFIFFQQFDIDNIRSLLLQTGIYAPIIFMLIKILVIIFAPMSGFPMFLLAGPLFGFFKGYLYLLTADLMGTSIAFYLSKKYGTKIIYEVMTKEKITSIKKILSSLSHWKGIVITRLIFPLQDVISYGAGLTKISYREFIIPTAIVKAISFIFLVALGLILLDKKTFFITMGIVFSIALIIVIYKFIKNRNIKVINY